jgi:DNA-directed RNA polymerase sigma subunit (sigma70/sigma32)
MTDFIAEVLAAMSERDRRIIELTFGSDKRPSRQSIGDELGITGARVRKLEFDACAKFVAIAFAKARGQETR